MSAEVPLADSVHVFLCGDPRCAHVHAVLLDARGEPLAQAVVDAETVQMLQRALYQKAATREEG